VLLVAGAFVLALAAVFALFLYLVTSSG